MTTVQDILQFIESIAPPELKLEGDNVGLLCGRADKEVETVLVALDPFVSVCREAVEEQADLLVTHHPIIHGSITSVTDQTTYGQAILKLMAHNISAVNAHTNLDCADGGVNDTLAHRLGLQDIQKNLCRPSRSVAAGTDTHTVFGRLSAASKAGVRLQRTAVCARRQAGAARG